MKRRTMANGFLENVREEKFVINRVAKMAKNGKIPYSKIMNEYNSHYGKNCHVNSLINFVRYNSNRIFS